MILLAFEGDELFGGEQYHILFGISIKKALLQQSQ